MTITFEDVSVVPMDSERVAGGQTVVVDGDRITWIGPAAQARIPSGAQRVDGRGKYLMPGLADMHCHPSDQDDLLLLVAYGVTTIRNLEGMPRHVLWRERIASGQLLGPTIHTSGPIVDGRPVRGLGSLSVVTREEAVAAVEHTKRGGYDCVKVYDQLSPEAYGWTMAAARERELPVVGHIPFRVGLHDVLAARQRSIEHLYGYPQAVQPASRPATMPRDLSQLRAWLYDVAQHADLARIPDLAGATRDAGTWNCPTLIIRARWAEDPATLSALPELQYLSPIRLDQARYFFSHYPKEPERHAVADLNAAVLRGLAEAGAGLMVGTDSGVPGFVFGATVHEELRAFVDAGLSPFQALRAATTAPAEFLGEAGLLGEITVGARADLLLLDANPLADISSTSRRAGVMAGGRWLPQAEISGLLAELAVRRQQPTPYRSRTAPLRRAPRHPAPRADELMRFDVTWDGHAVGEEEIVAARLPSGGRQISATSSIDSYGTALGSEAGVYRSSVTVDAAGIDQSAWFEFDGDDGVDRVEMTRVNGCVRIRHSEATHAPVEVTLANPDATALFGRPFTALFVRLAERLTGLGIGEETDVPVISPGISPDLSVGQATLHAVRLPGASTGGPGARYLVEFQRPSWTTGALITCDHTNRPVQLELSTDLSYWHNNAEGSEPDGEGAVRVTRAS
jgi:amidohydrolase family protein